VSLPIPSLRRLAVILALSFPLRPALAGESPGEPSRQAPGAEAAAPSDAPLTWRQVGADARYVFTRPAHLDNRGWLRFALAIGVGASLYLVRDEAREFAQDHGSETADQILDRARLMSRTATPLLASAGFYLAGAAGDSAYRKETAVLILENLGYAAAITGVAQRVVATERPRRGDDIDFFGGGEGHSVSGDVVIATSILAPVIDRHLQPDQDDSNGVRFWKRFGAVALYGTAGLVALQRVNVDAHWLPDAYFGYVCGLGVGKLLVDSRRGGREWREERRARRVEVSMTATGVRILWP